MLTNALSMRKIFRIWICPNQKRKGQVFLPNVATIGKLPIETILLILLHYRNLFISLFSSLPYQKKNQSQQNLFYSITIYYRSYNYNPNIMICSYKNLLHSFKSFSISNGLPLCQPALACFPFSKSRIYFANKQLTQSIKSSTILQPVFPLKPLQLNMKALAPNFFTKNLPMRENDKIKMPDRSANAVENSFIQLEIPVHADQEIRNSLVRLKSNQVRIGRILQCMDSIAGIVGYRHCFGSLSESNPFVLVTGSVDSINLFQPITIDQDIKMEGYVNYVGKTSMEIQINLFQSKILKSNALFTMVSRDANNHSKSYPCPKLVIQNLPQPQLSKAKKRKQQGQKNVQRRKKQMQTSYSLQPPSPQDTAIMHKIFLQSQQLQRQGVDTHSTIITNTRLMHIQQRNIHNKIFGGYLMREMVETGWIVASKFAASQDLHIEDITDVYFLAPVQIGCQLKVTGRVSYSNGNILVVTMESSTYFVGDGKQKLCCNLLMFFRCKTEQKKVFPKSYENGIYYLTSRNQFNHAFTQAQDIKEEKK